MNIRDARERGRAVYDAHVSAVRGVDTGVYTGTELDVWEAGISPDSYPIEDERVPFLVAEVDGVVAGLGEATLADPEVDKCYVDPADQNQGVASALVDELETRLQTHGWVTVSVGSSLNAAPFYESVGYERATGSSERVDETPTGRYASFAHSRARCSDSKESISVSGSLTFDRTAIAVIPSAT